MENYKKITILSVLLISISLSASKHTEFAFYPFGAYSTETSVMLGSHIVYEWKDTELPPNVRSSNIEMNVIASFKKQLRIYFGNRKVLKDNRLSIGMPVRFNNWPSEFYGVYLQDDPKEEEKYTPRGFELSPYLEYRVSKNMILSMGGSLKTFTIAKEEEDNPLLNNSIIGYEDYLIAGGMATLKLLTTDSVFYPTRGCSLAVNYHIYDEYLGSDYNFFVFSADYRRYHSISSKSILAAQIYTKAVHGTAPYSELADLGEEMRGYHENKHLNDKISIARVENRMFPFEGSFSRWGFALFAESGMAYSNYDEFNMENLKLSYGFGFRYMLVPSQKLNLRIDVAFSKENVEVDVISFEAF